MLHRLKRQITCSTAVLLALAGSVSLIPSVGQADASASQPMTNVAVPSQSDPSEAKKLITLADQLASGRRMPRDEAKAAQLYRRAAELGDPVGKMRFGAALVFGRGITVDTEQGISLIKAAAEEGYAGAMVLLADLHLRGLLGSQNRVRALDLLEEAAAKGQLVALVMLGRIYQTGDVVAADPVKAASYYKRAIASGRADAMVAFGRALVEGKLKGQGSASEGLALLEQAHRLGDKNAVIALGSYHKKAKKLIVLGDQLANGRGRPRDEKKAAQLYQQAAELGDPVGKMRFGAALVFGRGIAVNTEQGFSLIKSAAEGGDSGAMVLLADLHMRGLAGPKNRDRAVSLLEQAAAKGQLVALVRLGAIYQAGDIIKANPAKAAAYYKKAIASGRTDAMIAFGRALTEGKLKRQGQSSDGVALLKRAQELGDENAVIALSDCYIYGRGVRRNPIQAIEVLKAAWDAGNVKAGLRLVSLYRDGRKRIISRNPRQAKITLDSLAAKLPPAELKAERILERASQPSARAAYAELQTEFDGLPAESRLALVRRIRGTNLSLYLYLVQSQLDRLQLYKGEKSGNLSRGTVRAIYNHCIRYELPGVCSKGPLTPKVIEATAKAFQNVPAIAASTGNSG